MDLTYGTFPLQEKKERSDSSTATQNISLGRNDGTARILGSGGMT